MFREREEKRGRKHYFIIAVCIACAWICHFEKWDFVSFHFISVRFVAVYSFQHHVARLLSCDLNLFIIYLDATCCLSFVLFSSWKISHHNSPRMLAAYMHSILFFILCCYYLEKEEENKERNNDDEKNANMHCILMYLTTKYVLEEENIVGNQNNNKRKSFNGKNT